MKPDSANLDILRAIAVLCVLTDHLAGSSLVTDLIGQFGVLVFFVHTFLVLMMSLARQGTGPGWVRQFYVRRLFRIYPLPLFCLGALLALRIPIEALPPHHLKFSLGLVARNLLLIQPFSESIIGPMWSLPFEVKMYVLLPLMFVLLRRGPGWWEVLGLIFAAAIAILVATPRSAATDFFGYVPCFLGGGIAYLLDAKPRFPWWLWPLCVITLCAAFANCPAAGNFLLPSWVLCLALGCITPRFQECKSRALAKAAHLVAKYSYGIYLSHYPLIWWCLIERHGGWWVLIPSLFVAPVVLYYGIEQPMIRLGKRLTQPRREPANVTLETAPPQLVIAP